MLEKGARGAEINRRMFETKSRSLMDLEQLAVGGVQYFYKGKCALFDRHTADDAGDGRQ